MVVAVLGLDAGIEGEEGDAGNEYGSGDKPDLNLPGLQEEILEAAVSCGKPVILVLLSGSALAVNWADEHVDAIPYRAGIRGQEAELPLRIFYLGKQTRKENCRSHFTVPRKNCRISRTIPCREELTRYMESGTLYPFGYGLSYTEYAYKM